VRWIHDVFGNSIAIASFCESAAELRIESGLRLETYAAEQPRAEIAPEAASYPFIYSSNDRIDLGRMLELHHPDPSGRLRTWARAFVRGNRTDTLALLEHGAERGVVDWESGRPPGVQNYSTNEMGAGREQSANSCYRLATRTAVSFRVGSFQAMTASAG
jgi:hypothetical protein